MAGTLKFLHQLPIFTELVDQLAQSLNVNSYLIEKDYWLMHCLWGLQQQGWKFELKGGTSLSKGHAIIERFSEDIDIRFEPPADHALKTGKNHDKPAHIAARKDYFDWLAGQHSDSRRDWRDTRH
jgi:predicted nucleotidyltransferase component of viral defense system